MFGKPWKSEKRMRDLHFRVLGEIKMFVLCVCAYVYIYVKVCAWACLKALYTCECMCITVVFVWAFERCNTYWLPEELAQWVVWHKRMISIDEINFLVYASSNHWADDAEKEKPCPRKKENHVSHEIGLSYLAHKSTGLPVKVDLSIKLNNNFLV